MKRRTLSATNVAVYLSLNVEIIDDERGSDLLAWPLLSLAWLLMLPHVWQVLISKIQTTVRTAVDDLIFTLTVIQIGWRSLAWGVGLAQ